MKDAAKLLDHIQNIQDKASRLSGIMEALFFIDNENTCREGCSALVAIGRELAADINTQLDAVNLPKES